MNRTAISVSLLLAVAATADADESHDTGKPPARTTAAKGDGADTDPPPLPVGASLASPKFTLGVLRPATQAPPPLAQVQLNSSVLTNSDLSDTGAGSRTVTDTVFFNAATFRLMPKIADRTYLSADVGGAFVRYNDDASNGYDVLNANVGLLHQFDDNMVGELGWRYGQFFTNGALTDLEEQGVRLAIRRTDPFSADWFLTSAYEFQANFSRPNDRSRFSHFLRGGVGYNITPKIQAIVDYRLRYDDFFARPGVDSAARHEFRGQISYAALDNLFLAASVSYLLGDPIDILSDRKDGNASHDLSNLSFGAHVSFNHALLD